MALRKLAHIDGGANESKPALSSAAADVGAAAGTVSNELDKLVHDRVRLGIMSALAANESLSFTDLKNLLGTTDGNISVHARKLEDAGYVLCEKTFNGRVPLTLFRITDSGRESLSRYLNHMEALINAMKNAGRDI